MCIIVDSQSGPKQTLDKNDRYSAKGGLGLAKSGQPYSGQSGNHRGGALRRGRPNRGGPGLMAAKNGEKCIGYLKCLMICPDFAITVDPKPEQ
jgi:NAD-dependent dihydropyrimidine dehydrogenase PreA subunit